MLTAGRRYYVAVATPWIEHEFKRGHPAGFVPQGWRRLFAGVYPVSCPGWKGPIAMTVTPLAKDFCGFFLPCVINMLGHHLLWVQGLV